MKHASANDAGRAAEEGIAAVLRAFRVDFEQQVRVGKTIYGTALRVDFVARNLQAYPRGVILESKWQDVGGSIDEKFPYLVENIRLAYPLPAIVIVHGGGCRPGAVHWLRSQCDDHLVAVFGLEEFISWVHRAEKSLPLPRAGSTAELRPACISTLLPSQTTQQL